MVLKFTREVLASIPSRHDLDVHFSTLQSEYGMFFEVREYVPSIEKYGRGTTFTFDPEDLSETLRSIAGKLDGLDS